MKKFKLLIPWLTFVFMTGVLLCGCGNQSSTAGHSGKSANLPAFNAEQSKTMFRDIIEKLNDTDVIEYPGTNPSGTMAEFGVYYIARNQRDLVKNRQVKLSDVQHVVKEYFGKEILQPVSTKRLTFDGNSFTLKPYGKEWIDQYDIQSIKPLPNDEYQVFATVAEKATSYNNFKSKVYLYITAKFSRRMVEGKERFIVLEYATKPEKGNNANESVAGYKTYNNDRFGFSIDYPGSFVVENSPTNGDGLSLTSPDRRATLTISGGSNSGPNGGSSLKEYLSMITKGKNANPVLGDNWFVVSWKENGHITYCKMFVGRSLQTSFRITYPEDQKEQYDSIVDNLEKSFRPGNLDKAGGRVNQEAIENPNKDIDDFIFAMANIPRDAKYYGGIVTQALPHTFSQAAGQTKMIGNIEVVWSGFSYYRDRTDIGRNVAKYSLPQNSNFVMEYEIALIIITVRNPKKLRTFAQSALQAAVRVMDRPESVYPQADGGLMAKWDDGRVLLMAYNDSIKFIWKSK